MEEIKTSGGTMPTPDIQPNAPAGGGAIVCIVCGTENETDKKYCVNCGAPLSEGRLMSRAPAIAEIETAAPFIGVQAGASADEAAPVSDSVIECIGCGTENDTDRKYCVNCGLPLSEGKLVSRSSGGAGSESGLKLKLPVFNKPVKTKTQGDSTSIPKLLLIVIVCAVLVGVGIFAAVSLSQNNADDELGVASAYLDAGDYQEAKNRYAEIIEAHPRKADAYIGLSNVYIAEGEYDDAMSILLDASEKIKNSEALKYKVMSVENEMMEQLTAPNADMLTWRNDAGSETVTRIVSQYAERGLDPMSGEGVYIIDCNYIAGRYYANILRYTSETVDGITYYLYTGRQEKRCVGSWAKDSGYVFTTDLKQQPTDMVVFLQKDNDYEEIRQVSYEGGIRPAVAVASGQTAQGEYLLSPSDTFVRYYLSFLTAINELDESRIEYCSEQCYADTSARIYKQNRNNTFYCREILLDMESVSYSADGNTVTFNVKCESDMYSRDGTRYAGINTAYRAVTAKYHDSGAWYIDAAVYKNNLYMSGNVYKAY